MHQYFLPELFPWCIAGGFSVATTELALLEAVSVATAGLYISLFTAFGCY